MKLTEKQKRFADYYIETGNATESAKLAGYKQPHVQGSQNLEKLSVSAYIDEQLKKLADKRIMNAQEALEFLSSVARGEITETSVTATGDVVEKSADIKDRIKATESILKRYPMNKHDELKEQLLEAQINKTKAETKNEEEGASRVVILNDKEAMKKAMRDDS